MKNKISFKSKWNSKDEICPTCGQVTKSNVGLTKQNLLKLFKKPSMQDWLIFIIIILILLAALTYQSEVQQCKYFMENPEKFGYFYDGKRDTTLIISLDTLISQEEIFEINENENS